MVSRPERLVKGGVGRVTTCCMRLFYPRRRPVSSRTAIGLPAGHVPLTLKTMIGHRERPFVPPVPAMSPTGAIAASPARRLAGRLVDTVLLSGSVSLWAGLTSVVVGTARPGAAVGALVVVVLQAVLVATRAQSFGKVVMRTMMVDAHGAPVGFVRGFLMREGPLMILKRLPGPTFLLSLADIAFIFREDRRCLHDHFAGTRVVDCDR